MHVGEVFGGHGTPDDHSGGPNGQNLENLRFLKAELREYAQVMVKCLSGGVGTSINTVAASHQCTKHNAL